MSNQSNWLTAQVEAQDRLAFLEAEVARLTEERDELRGLHGAAIDNARQGWEAARSLRESLAAKDEALREMIALAEDMDWDQDSGDRPSNAVNAARAALNEKPNDH